MILKRLRSVDFAMRSVIVIGMQNYLISPSPTLQSTYISIQISVVYLCLPMSVLESMCRLINSAVTAIIAISVVMALSGDIQAQKKTIDPSKFQTWVYLYEGSNFERGYLRDVSKESILVSKELLPSTQTGYRSIDIPGIHQVKVRNKSKQAWGALIGLVGGAGIGALAGWQIEGGDFCGGKCGGTEPGTLVALSAVGMGIVGTFVGISIGSGKKSFKLNGQMTDPQFDELSRYAIKSGQ